MVLNQEATLVRGARPLMNRLQFKFHLVTIATNETKFGQELGNRYYAEIFHSGLNWNQNWTPENGNATLSYLSLPRS